MENDKVHWTTKGQNHMKQMKHSDNNNIKNSRSHSQHLMLWFLRKPHLTLTPLFVELEEKLSVPISVASVAVPDNRNKET